MEKNELKIKVTKELIEKSIKFKKLAGLHMLYRRLENLLLQLPESDWISLKELFVTSGEPDFLNNLYYSKWKDQIETEKYNEEMFTSAVNALQKKNIYGYINGCNNAGKEVDKIKIFTILKKTNYKLFRGYANSIKGENVRDFYNRLKEKVPNDMLKKIQRQSKKTTSFNDYFWACNMLNELPVMYIMMKYYKVCYDNADLDGMKKAKKMIGSILPKRVIYHRAMRLIKEGGKTAEAEKFLEAYYS